MLKRSDLLKKSPEQLLAHLRQNGWSKRDVVYLLKDELIDEGHIKDKDELYNMTMIEICTQFRVKLCNNVWGKYLEG